MSFDEIFDLTASWSVFSFFIVIYIVNVHVDLKLLSAPHSENAIAASEFFSVARDELYLTRAMLWRRLIVTYELHCNDKYSVTSRLTQQSV